MMVKQRVVLSREPGYSLLPAGSERLNYRCCLRAMSTATGIGQISEPGWIISGTIPTTPRGGRTGTMDESLNVLGEPLELCGENPLTGYYRDGRCNTCSEDHGSHTVCIEASKEFLEYSRFKGNDLSTPAPEYGFKGLRAGDRWCLCAARWLQASQDQRAPRVYLQRTHIRALEIVPIELLKQYAADLN